MGQGRRSEIAALVRRHHERVRDSSIHTLLPGDPARFAAAIDKFADFVIEAVGGAARYTMGKGPGGMSTQHRPFMIDERSRHIWPAQMLLALGDVDFPGAIHGEFWNWVELMSIGMVHRRSLRAQSQRYPWSEAAVQLFPFMTTRRPQRACQR
jgi:hemoglobin